MRNLIIGDVHLKIKKVQTILDEEKYDKVYFLGDFFDDWDDSPLANFIMAEYLNKIMKDPRLEFIIGNHDAHYFWPNRDIRCSGYEYDKYTSIGDILDKTMVGKRFRFHHVVDDWLLTHAGLHPGWLQGQKTLKEIDLYLLTEKVKCCDALKQGKQHWFFTVGSSREGRAPFGGIEWCDAYAEFEAIPDIKQVFGHTFCGAEGRVNKPYWPRENNVDIDTAMNYYAIIENGKLEIKDYYLLT